MEKPRPPSPCPTPPHFSIPVDSDGKATVFHPFTISSPHMRAFHLAWLSLFSNFFATFSIPPLLPLIRRDLHLSPSDVGHAGIASFLGAILSRLAMGPVCDVLGPRIASASLSLLTAPFILAASFVSSPLSFILVRFLIGFSLANFVSNQFWMSTMFSSSVVGLANGVSAGWANVGSGLTQLAMPLVFALLTNIFNIPSHIAWRVSFIVPATFQVITAVMVLSLGQDTPCGTYRQHKQLLLRQSNKKNSKRIKGSNSNIRDILLHGLGNYRAWILALTYGYCFGVEMTTENVIAGYFYETFGVGLEVAGLLGSAFGMVNCVSRPIGGVVSDEMGRRFGMRGRLWVLWAVQTVAGLVCVVLGRVDSLVGAVIVLCCFGLLVQAASGMTFGIVPFVSRRSVLL